MFSLFKNLTETPREIFEDCILSIVQLFDCIPRPTTTIFLLKMRLSHQPQVVTVKTGHQQRLTHDYLILTRRSLNRGLRPARSA